MSNGADANGLDFDWSPDLSFSSHVTVSVTTEQILRTRRRNLPVLDEFLPVPFFGAVLRGNAVPHLSADLAVPKPPQDAHLPEPALPFTVSFVAGLEHDLS